MAERPNTPVVGHTLARLGGLIGLVVGLAHGVLRFSSNPAPAQGADLIGELAFFVAYTAPFALALFTLRLRNNAQRAALWLGVAILSFSAAVATFSIVSFTLLPWPALLLLIAAGQAYRAGGQHQVLLIVSLAVSVVLIGSVAWLVLFSQEDPRCWALIRSANGTDVWQAVPYSASSPMISGEPQPGDVIQWMCASDVISAGEGGLSLGLWGLACLGLGGFLPRWPGARPAATGSAAHRLA